MGVMYGNVGYLTSIGINGWVLVFEQEVSIS